MSQRVGISSKPRPRIGPDNKAFWDGCKNHKLLLPFCQECGEAHLPPGPVCPFCLSERLEWRETNGRGTLSSWVMVHQVWYPAFAEDIPYNVIQVELDDGPRLTAKLVGGGEKISVGQKVISDFEDVDDALTLLCFRPA